MKNIIVIQTGKLGDMVCTTPVFRAIKNSYPASRLYVSGDAINKSILKGNPYINYYILYKDIDTRSLKDLNLDVAILLNPNPDILLKLCLAHIKQIIVPKVVGGYSPYMTKTYRLLSLFATRAPHRMGHYAPQEYLNMLAPIGILSGDTKKELWADSAANEKATSLLNQFGNRLKIGIAPGAGNKIKEWPPEKFAELAKILQTKYHAAIILFGSDKDKVLSAIMKEGLDESNTLDTVGKLSVEELKATISRMDLFISADTGPIYIAESYGVRTIDIVGPVDEREQPPSGVNHLVVLPPGRERPLLYVMNAREYDVEEVRRVAARTSVKDVLEAVMKLLKS